MLYAILPLEEGRFLYYGPVVPRSIPYETYVDNLSVRYSPQDIRGLFHLSRNGPRMDVIRFCQTLALFMDYVMELPCRLSDILPQNQPLPHIQNRQSEIAMESMYERFSRAVDSRLLQAVRMGDVPTCRELLGNTVLLTPELSGSDISVLWMTAISSLAVVLYNGVMGGLRQEFFEKTLQTEMINLTYYSTVQQMEDWLHGLTLHICQQVSAAHNESRYPNSLSVCLEYIEAHPYQKMTVESLSEISGVSRSTLDRYFREHLKVGPAQYVLEMKLKEGERLLQITQLSIAEISYDLGFSSQSHFSKCFQAKYGLSPLRYRRKASGNRDG